MQETGQAVGTVVDLYDGTGTNPLHAATSFHSCLPSSSFRSCILLFAADPDRLVPILCSGTYDTLRVQLSNESDSGASTSNRTVLLPFATEMVPVVDRQARRMEITPPAGLLDIVTSQEKKKKDVRRRPAPRTPYTEAVLE